MGIKERLDDAEALWSLVHTEGAFLLALLSVAALSKQEHPKLADGYRIKWLEPLPGAQLRTLKVALS